MKTSAASRLDGPWTGLLNAMLHAVWLVDAASLRIVGVNAAGAALLGTTTHSLIDKPVLELAATPEDLCFWGDVADGSATGIESQTVVRRFDGGVVAVTRRVSRIDLAAGQAFYVVALHDRSEQVKAERAMDVAVADLQATLESTADGILVTDLAGRIRNFNQRFAVLWNLPDKLLRSRDDDAVFAWMRRSVVDPAAYMRQLAWVDATDAGTAAPEPDQVTLACGTVLERVSLPQRSGDAVIGRVFCFRDITERIRASERIDELSHSDALTGLANRARLLDRIASAFALARRDGTPFALLVVNLDRFARINETLGHPHGDRVLRDVAQRLKAGVREVDTVARIGGDEFVVLVQEAAAAGATATAQRVLLAMQRPFEHDGFSFTVTASIGIALHPGDGPEATDLLRGADTAMRDAKQAGRAGFRFHSRRGIQHDPSLRSAMQLDHAMRQALTQGHFRLHYQPQVDVRDGTVRGAEALIRWTDPELGPLSPGEFIPVAEASGFIVAIDAWVLREAVRQAVEWHRGGAKGLMSVNISALQFQQPGFVDSVAAVLTDTGLDPAWLELELTESILIRDEREALRRLAALARLGVRLAIDDFGTGYSSLAYLKRFPIGRLKIDRSFIKGLPDDASDAGIVNAIVQMGRALHLDVIAEGVETEAQRRFLAEAGCAQYQGFLFAAAVEASVFEARWGGAPAVQHPGIRRIH